MWVPTSLWVRGSAATPARTVLMLHGILGSARNLRTLATRLVQARPDVQVLIADLRNHGDATGPQGGGKLDAAAPPPHTLQACASDLLALCAAERVQPAMAVGHSYGGKVALELARLAPPWLRSVWVLDAVPNLRAGQDESPASVERVIAALWSVPQPLPTRQAVADELAVRGFAPDLCQWMTTNVAQASDGYRWKFDLAAVEEMLASYFATDSWPVLRAPPPGVRIDVVRAGRSDRWTHEILRTFDELTKSSAHSHPAHSHPVHLHVLPDAGHWVHVDDPTGVLRLLLGGVEALWPVEQL